MKRESNSWFVQVFSQQKLLKIYQRNGSLFNHDIKMDERHKFFLLIIFGLIVCWFLVILLCLPQDDSIERWPPVREGDDKVGRSIYQPTYRNKSPHLTRYFQPKFKPLDMSETLFYDFDPAKRAITNGSISRPEHENATLQLRSINSLTDQWVRSGGYKLFSFNLLVSNRIGLIRPLPDTRNKKCHEANKAGDYSPYSSSNINLKASIIICYYDEAPSALLRTIFTVLAHSPTHLIKQIIVIDDSSNSEFHMDKIRPFVGSDLVTILRTPKREGLIRARLFGAKVATGDVLIFLDSHVEANVGWLEPLLKVVQDNKTTIACPMIDIINADTLIYSPSPMVRGGMNWALNFKWDSIPSDQLKTYDDFVKPIESPTMAGGLYAINRDFFYHIGAYDPGMDLWGGENIELSMRTWMCGGRILLLPCSRLGHIFRKNRPYGSEPNQPDSLLINSHRSARVWLDGYIDKFYQSNPDARYLDSGDVSQRLELRKNLGCHNFSWFLNSIYPSLMNESLKFARIQHKPTQPPKLFDLSSRQKNKSFNRRIGDMKSILLQRKLRMATNDIGRYDSRRSQVMKFNFKHGYTPKIISRFQIQVHGSNLCIESKSGFMAKRFSRLVLNGCETAELDANGEILMTSSNIRNQLWTETEFHDYRLGDDQCLDLMKNLPSLRKCHNMGSSQNWTHYNQTIGTHIYNTGGRLCLGVERIQIGEPLIVTICYMDFNDKFSLHRKVNLRTSFSDRFLISSWRAGSESKQSDNIVGLKPLKPSQRWNLILVGGSNASIDLSSVSSSVYQGS